jgi:hypothetical protein
MGNNKRAVRAAFYDELETALDGLVPPSHITTEYPEREEEYPTVVHSLDVFQAEVNSGSSPIDVVTNGGGEVTGRIFSRRKEAQFSLLCRTIGNGSESELSDIVAALIDHFDPYEHPYKDPSDIHSSVDRVVVGSTTRADESGTDPVANGVLFTVSLYYTNTSTHNVEPIRTANRGVDTDNDGISDSDSITN